MTKAAEGAHVVVSVQQLWMLLILLIPLCVAGCATLMAEGIARTINDPGPTVTVAMVPIGPPSADSGRDYQQTVADSSRCTKNAQVGAGHRIGSQATRAKLATELYVVCMVGQGYRCVDRSEHKVCAGAWGHPTATREQLLKDAEECRKAVFWTLGLASTVHARYLECMSSKGYHADRGEPTSGNPPPASTPDDQRQELTTEPPNDQPRELITEPPVR